jgi:histidinol-phosphate aminotransferase
LPMRLDDLIKNEVRGQKAYVAETSILPIRLDANESPFPLTAELHDEFLATLGRVSLNRYPEAGSPTLLARFAANYGVTEDMLIAGNGSDEMIQVLCTSLAPTRVMTPVPTFVMYRISAVNNGHTVIEAPLDDDCDLDLPAMLELMDVHAPGLVFLCFPNNPTGNCFSREKMATLLSKAPGLVVVDEAYGYFSGQTFLPLLERYENLVILKTLSKVGLAALRIGFLIGASPLVRQLNKVRLPYNINSLSQAAASFYLDHEAVFLAQAAEVVRGRKELFCALQQLPGIRPYPSEANFIFFNCLCDANRIYTSLREQGIMVKHFPVAGNFQNCIRVTVGTQRENGMFLGALERIVAE